MSDEFEFGVGDHVTGEVEWPNGRITTMSGEVIAVTVDTVYVETSLGPVAMDLGSVERAE